MYDPIILEKRWVYYVMISPNTPANFPWELIRVVKKKKSYFSQIKGQPTEALRVDAGKYLSLSEDHWLTCLLAECRSLTVIIEGLCKMKQPGNTEIICDGYAY